MAAVYAYAIYGFYPGTFIIAVIYAFVVSFFLIHCVGMICILPAYLAISVILSPAKGVIVGAVVGVIYGAVIPWFQTAAYYAWGLLNPAGINLWSSLEPWQTGIFFGSIYGSLIGCMIGVYEKEKDRSQREQPSA